MTSSTTEFSLTRRSLFGAGLALCFSSVAKAKVQPINGLVGLVCSPDGIAGMVLNGEDSAILSPNLLWHIGSNTKAMTAVLYARLVDLGRCRWNATIFELFPSIKPHPAWSGLHIEHFLSHAAGLTDDILDKAWLYARFNDAASPRQQRLSLVRRILESPPTEASGVYRYGNLNYVLIGAAIEEAENTSWENSIRRRVFEPLGMRDAGYGAPLNQPLWGREMNGGQLNPVDPSGLADNPAVLWPSGGVHLSAGSYAQFLSLFLRNGEPLLLPKTFAHLIRPIQSDRPYAGGWVLAGNGDDIAGVLTHDGSNTLWYATATVDVQKRRAYAAIVNRADDRGEQEVTELVSSLR